MTNFTDTVSKLKIELRNPAQRAQCENAYNASVAVAVAEQQQAKKPNAEQKVPTAQEGVNPTVQKQPAQSGLNYSALYLPARGNGPEKQQAGAEESRISAEEDSGLSSLRPGNSGSGKS